MMQDGRRQIRLMKTNINFCQNMFYPIQSYQLMTQRIKVFIRPKPLLQEQIKPFTNIDYINGIISLNKTPDKLQSFTITDHSSRSFAFSKIFDQTVSQQEIYQSSAFSIIENVLEGYNGTIFAYGQTGSGKTYTIMGGKEYIQNKNPQKKLAKVLSNSHFSDIQVNQYLNDLKGIIPRSFNQIITVVNSRKDKKHLIQCYFIEIYNENVHDLLGQDTKLKLNLKENASKGLVIDGLKTFLVKSVQDLQKFFRIGYRNRSIRHTPMNKESSRSHCIFSIKLEEQTLDEFGNPKFKVGKLNLVDLAGSERQSKTNIKEQGLKEATKINLSLSALGKVINCLSNSRQNQKIYIPYRDSKLTRILQDSLGGNTKTVMIATISQHSANYEQTLSTLIYASRAKFIQNRPVLNEDPKDVLLRQYVHEIEKLKILLLEKEIENEGLRKTSIKFNQSPPIQKKDIEVISELDQNKIIEEYKSNKIEEEEIKKKLQNLENIVKKQDVNSEQEMRELEKIKLLKKKIHLQEERQVELENQKRLREQELQYIQTNYNNLNEEVDILRNKFKDLKQRYNLKEQEMQDFRKEYNEEREDFGYILKEKDRQIKKLQKLLETVLEEHTYKQIVNNDQSGSEKESLHTIEKKLTTKLESQRKSKIIFNQSNLFKSASSQKYVEKKLPPPKDKAISQMKVNFSSQRNLVQARNYESEHQKKVKISTQLSSSSYTNMNLFQNETKKEKVREKQIEKQREQIRKASIKKVDSMISLKSIKRDDSLKLPFITEVKKLSAPKKIESEHTQKSEYASKLSLDIARIKDQIINELKSKGKVRG